MDLRVEHPKRRLLPAPEPNLLALVERAPQAEEWISRLLEKLHPRLAGLYAARRRLATAGIALLTVWLSLHVMFGANGMVIYRQKRAEYQGLKNEIDELQKENDRYAGEIKALQTDPKTIEKEAREQLHYARPGEIVYVTPAARPPAPAADSAHK
jgi:cell division protein FtsB